MNIITPRYSSFHEPKAFRDKGRGTYYQSKPSFKGSPQTLIAGADKKVLDVFKRYYGGVSERMGKKLSSLITYTKDTPKSMVVQAKRLKYSARYNLPQDSIFKANTGISSIKDKNILRSIGENLIFPFVTLPSYFGSWLLQKFESVPGNGKLSTAIKNKATKIRDTYPFRVPRKINDMDSLTDSLKGMYEKTAQLISSFEKEKGMKSGSLPELLKKSSAKLSASDKKLQTEADEYLKENLYKVSNKFFDKHTGNFNTAYERPLNRIVSGMIPVAFLANDAYNLSVLCGDKKEDSVKEANIRKKQEISRVMTTAYIQLLTFGAFTKLVNTKSWFTPFMSAATVLGSEIFARKRLHRPIMFLSKDAAKEYNKKHNTNIKNKEKETKQEVASSTPISSTSIKPKNKKENVFTSFKSNETKTEQKKEQPKALINFQTFKKGVGILLAGGFILSFLKNSSFTKNSTLVNGMKSAFKKIKEKVYDPFAYKDFEMSEETFKNVTASLHKINCGKIAEGHEFVKDKYTDKTLNGVIKLYNAKLPKEKIDGVIGSTIEQLRSKGINFADKEAEVTKSIKTAIKLSGDKISEFKFSSVAKKAAEIIDNKKIPLSKEQKAEFVKTLAEQIDNAKTKEYAKVDTKLKPFMDMVTQPFKFIGSVLAFPFKKLATPVIGLLTGPVEKKAQKALLGQKELNGFEKAVHRVVTEIFGEKTQKKGKISQEVFTNAMEQLDNVTKKYRKAQGALEEAKAKGVTGKELDKLRQKVNKESEKLKKYVDTAVEKSFNGVTQSSNKNTDLALMSKLASSTVTSAFLVADNYNMVMLKSDGEDKEGAREKANERIIQRLSALFYQSMLINWFNSTFTSLYNSSLKGMAAVVAPNTIATEVLTRKSIGMPIRRKTLDELNAIDEKNENRKGFLGHYFKFMRLLTGKKPLKDRLPKNKQNNISASKTAEQTVQKPATLKIENKANNTVSTNLLNKYIK